MEIAILIGHDDDDVDDDEDGGGGGINRDECQWSVFGSGMTL